MEKGVTIFIPVYNEEYLIEKAIRCAAPQCKRLIVSDNASTDSTGQVCKKMLAEYSNLEFVQQEQNIGALNNWLYLLSLVNTEFVMALGSHDTINSNYISSLQETLENDPSTELAVGELYFEQNSRLSRCAEFSDWNKGEQETAHARVKSCIFDRAPLGWTAYGLFRTNTIKNVLLHNDNPPYGIDIILLARIASIGKIKIDHRTAYIAPIQDNRQRTHGYLERLIGKQKNREEEKKLRNDFRKSLYEIYLQTLGDDSTWNQLIARHQFMVRLGIFRVDKNDPLLAVLRLPVTIARRLRRPF